MRITGGIHRGRSLTSPKGSSTRPTSDRARESVFNILRHGGWHQGILEDATVLDVFAGTGALGLEALSQGAKHAVFIERDRAAAALCQDNIDKLGETARALVLKCDAAAPAPRPAHVEPRSLVFLDPPYGKGLGATALKVLEEKGWLQDSATCVMEMSKKEPEAVPAGFTLMDERTYGIARVIFFVRNAL
jgi:16S rRNA (guanine966-N2)-methyltransferase